MDWPFWLGDLCLLAGEELALGEANCTGLDVADWGFERGEADLSGVVCLRCGACGWESVGVEAVMTFGDSLGKPTVGGDKGS